jgi:hypothetical protein
MRVGLVDDDRAGGGGGGAAFEAPRLCCGKGEAPASAAAAAAAAPTVTPPPASGIDALDDNVLPRILALLPVHGGDLGRAMGVCKHWASLGTSRGAFVALFGVVGDASFRCAL